MNRFDLEQQILECWKVTDDINMVTAYFIDDPKWADMDAELADAIMNKYYAIKELYELKFEQLWATFEKVIANERTIKCSEEEQGKNQPDALQN